MKILLSISLLLAMASSLALADCAGLIKKYEAPDPASKTMAQIERWVQRAVTDAAEAAEITKCLIAGAADNPNKVQVAGK
jgi:hypothetical protein